MPTYHYVQNQGKLIMQGRESGQNLSLDNFLTISRSNISKLQILLKSSLNQIEVHI